MRPSSFPPGTTIVVGVGAGIAAYKSVQVVRDLRRADCQVYVVPTPAALEFVGVQTWRELSENPVATDVFHGEEHPGHVRLAREADLVLIAPCTADLLARLRSGMANDLLTATVLATSAPVLLAPAMHTNMWTNPATQDNVAVLRERGVHILPPVSGELSSGDTGLGRLPAPQEITTAAAELLDSTSDPGPLTGIRIMISAGGTIEPVDPVRYLGNFSSGTQGVELAKTAHDLGASVTLLAAHCDVALPPESERMTVVPTPTARQMLQQVSQRLPGTDVLIMAAAVADYRPVAAANAKLKKSQWGSAPTIELTENPDILREVAHSPDRPPLVIGFAAETGDIKQVLEYGRQKAVSKGADLIAINKVGDGQGFGAVDNTLWVVDREGALVSKLEGPKSVLADGLIQLVVGARL